MGSFALVPLTTSVSSDHNLNPKPLCLAYLGALLSPSPPVEGIRQLQLVLLKVALLLGVEVHVGVEFKNLLEPQNQNHNPQSERRQEPELHTLKHPRVWSNTNSPVCLLTCLPTCLPVHQLAGGWR